jgi:hypothetical protein
MTFTVNDIRVCAAGNHLVIDITPAGRTMRSIRCLRQDILDEIDPDTQQEAEQWILRRLIAAVKEATSGTPTNLQVRNALVGNTYEI